MSIHWGGRGSGHISRWSDSTSGVPSLVLEFLSGTLDPRITFTRSTTATFTGSNGLIQNSAIDAPRFEYNPITLQPIGLLIEEQRTNLVVRSAELTNASWTKTNCTITGNASTAPDGTLTAQLFTATTITAHCYQVITALTTATYACSVYVKRGNTPSITLTIVNVADAITYNFDTGVIGGLSGSTATATNVGNGWIRLQFSRACNAGNFGPGIKVGVVGGTVSVWGFQFEQAGFSTSYIPTVAAQVTRGADIAVMTGTNFSSWYNNSSGTFVAKYETSRNLFATYIAASNGVVGQNSVHFDNDSGGTMRAVYYSGSSAQAILSLGAYGTAGALNTVASAYAVDSFAASRNGGAVVTDTSGALPVSLTQFNIGADPSGVAANVTNTHIVSISYYNTRLSDSQLQVLSS